MNFRNIHDMFSTVDVFSDLIILLCSWVRNVFMYLLCSLGLFIIALLVLGSVVKLMIIKVVLGMLGQSFHILSGLDACLQYVHPSKLPNSEVIITAITLLKGRLNFNSYRRLIQERFVDARKWPGGPKCYPVMNQRITRRFGYYIWVEDEAFSIDHHVRMHASSYSDDASLVEIVSSMANVPFSKDHSPWEFVFIPRVSKMTLSEKEYLICDGFAMVSRYEHSLFDGLGSLEVFKDFCDESSRKQLIDFKKSALSKMSKSSPVLKSNPFIRYMMTERRLSSFTGCMNILLNAVYILLTVPWYLMEPCLHEESNTLHTQKLDGQTIIAFSDRVDLQLCKDIASSYNCTINVVFFCCLSRAFRKCDAYATMVRAVIATALLPPGNQISQNGTATSFVDLPLQYENSESRLQNYYGLLNKSILSPEPIIQFFICNLIGNHLPLLIAKALLNVPKYTLLTTNLRGPPFKVFHNGCLVTDNFFIPNNLQSAGVGFSIMSYNGALRFAVSVDRAVASDDKIAQRLVNGCVQELQDLCAFAMKKEKSQF